MEQTDGVVTLGVGTGDERVILRLTRRTLAAEVSPEYWQRIEESVRSRLDDGTLIGSAMGALAAQSVHRLKRWYLGPHDIAAVNVTFDGHTLRVQRHGLGDLFGSAVPSVRAGSWYATLDAVGGAWSEGFDPEEAEAFVRRFRDLREERLRSLGYGIGVAARTVAATLGVAGIVAAVAWTLRTPKKPS